MAYLDTAEGGEDWRWPSKPVMDRDEEKRGNAYRLGRSDTHPIYLSKKAKARLPDFCGLT